MSTHKIRCNYSKSLVWDGFDVTWTHYECCFDIRSWRRWKERLICRRSLPSPGSSRRSSWPSPPSPHMSSWTKTTSSTRKRRLSAYRSLISSDFRCPCCRWWLRQWCRWVECLLRRFYFDFPSYYRLCYFSLNLLIDYFWDSSNYNFSYFHVKNSFDWLIDGLLFPIVLGTSISGSVDEISPQRGVGSR